MNQVEMLQKLSLKSKEKVLAAYTEVVRVPTFTGDLKCGRCPVVWHVTGLVLARLEVRCPKCGEPNSIAGARKRAEERVYAEIR